MKTELKFPKTTANNPDAGSMSALASKTNGGQSSVSREFQNFIADIEDLIKATTTLSGDDLARATAKLSERVAAAKDSVTEMGDEIVTQTRNIAADTNNYVHKQPWEAVGAGMVVAFLLGLFFARRN